MASNKKLREEIDVAVGLDKSTCKIRDLAMTYEKLVDVLVAPPSLIRSASDLIKKYELR